MALDPQLLFASYYCTVDPSSGAAVSTRDLLRLMAGCGWRTRVFCGPALDFEQPVEIVRLLGEQGIVPETRECSAGVSPFALHHFMLDETRATIYAPARPAAKVPTGDEGAAYLTILHQLLETERPDVMLTYGGNWVAREAMRLARRRGTAAAFALKNFYYFDRTLFDSANAVWVPSQFAAELYRRRLGLECTPIPNPLNWDRILCEPDPGRQFVTFVNPQPAKGVFIFARIALELGNRRPDIPLLVVEGRGQAKRWLEQTGLDLSCLENLHRMANTPDPRHFYRVSRMVLMPSLCNESFGRVAAEAMVNGIPVLASNRGALPEVVGPTGLLFEIPSCYTPQSRTPPTADEVAPWVETIIRLWDDGDLYDRERDRCLQVAKTKWRPERAASLYDAFFRQIAAGCNQATAAKPCGAYRICVDRR